MGLALLGGCGSSGGNGTPTQNSDPPPPSGAAAQVAILMMGNSHTSLNDLPRMVGAMVQAGSGKTTEVVVAPDWLSLQQRAQDTATLALLRSRPWRFVVLQAQDYSSSGLFTYPIDGAVDLVGKARAAGALPILFPEWPRKGIDETQRIYELHLSIARAAPACVPPIPQAFDVAKARYPEIELWAGDGNHSSTAGAFLAAMIIATTMTGVAPDTLPVIPNTGIDAITQAKLRSVAAETVRTTSTRTGCPGDAVGA